MACEQFEVYKCPKCGIMLEVVKGGGGSLKCCDNPMERLDENVTDAAQEKHVPVFEQADGGYRISVGSAPHPMEDAHFIEWVEVIADGKAYKQFLKPGEKPEAFIPVEGQAAKVRAYCNLHGLWKG